MGIISHLCRSGVAVVAAGALAFGMATASVAQEPKQGGTLVAAFSADPGGFDPARGPSGMSHIAIEQVFSTLLLLDENAKPYGGLAHEWSSSEDGLTWTFKLREGLKFHNGEALTADDVVFSFDRIRKPDSGYAYLSQVETIEKVTAVDDLTVEFKLSRPTGPFEIYMAFPGSSIVPKDLVESGWDLNAKPVGSGPFKFVSYEPRSVIKFERNPDYHEKGKPYFDAMEYRIISDPTALSNGMKSGEIHFSNEVPPKDWAAITGQAGMVDAALEGSRYYWLVPNHKQEPLGKPKVRQAIAIALNREAIVRGAFYGQATPYRRRDPAMELGLCRHRLLQAGRRYRGGEEAAGGSRRQAGRRNQADHGLVLAAHDVHGADHSGQPVADRLQGDDRHHGGAALLGRGVGPEQVRHHRHVLAEPAGRPGRLRHQHLSQHIAGQHAEGRLEGDGRPSAEGEVGGDPG